MVIERFEDKRTPFFKTYTNVIKHRLLIKTDKLLLSKLNLLGILCSRCLVSVLVKQNMSNKSSPTRITITTTTNASVIVFPLLNCLPRYEMNKMTKHKC